MSLLAADSLVSITSPENMHEKMIEEGKRKGENKQFIIHNWIFKMTGIEQSKKLIIKTKSKLLHSENPIFAPMNCKGFEKSKPNVITSSF